MLNYSIGEFAALVNVPTSTLRYYENEGLISPSRDGNNSRKYTEADAGWVHFILHLKNAGMTMNELKQYTEWREKGDETIPERKELLEKRKALVDEEIEALKKNAEILHRKIAFYEDRLQGYTYDFVL